MVTVHGRWEIPVLIYRYRVLQYCNIAIMKKPAGIHVYVLEYVPTRVGINMYMYCNTRVPVPYMCTRVWYHIAKLLCLFNT